MARVRHTFLMSEPPEQAQERFTADVVPRLKRFGRFGIVRESPGSIVLNDGLVDPHSPSARKFVYVRLAKLMGRRLRVTFTPSGGGTEVSIRGTAIRPICHDIEHWGEPGRWPTPPRRATW